MSNSKIVRNWKYYAAGASIGELCITEGQFMTGNVAGILITAEKPFFRFESICNAKTFRFPVRYKIIDLQDSYGPEQQIEKAIHELEHEGCRFIVTSGGELGIYAEFIKDRASVLTMASPLQCLHFMSISVSSQKKFAIVTSQPKEIIYSQLDSFGVTTSLIDRCEIIPYRDIYSKDPSSLDFIDSRFGGIIWDSINSDFIIRQTFSIPVYSMVTITRFLKNVCTHKPYNGLI